MKLRKLILIFILAWASGLYAKESANAVNQTPDYAAEIARGIDAGLPVDQALDNVLQNNPDAVNEIEKAVKSLMKTMPYGGSCDDCGCGGGAALSEYPITDLEGGDQSNWIKEVIDRYENNSEELILPNYGEMNLFPFFYHFMSSLEQIKPYLDGEEPDAAAVAAMVERIDTLGLEEPVRLVLTSLGNGSHVRDGRILLAAAAELGLESLPVRFSFTECAICENRSDSSNYAVDEMRRHNDLNWTRNRFFDETEFVFVDKEYPGNHDFDYHMEPSIEQMLEYFSGDPDQEAKDKWKEKLQANGVGAIPITLNYGSKEMDFGKDNFEPEDVHAMLTAAQEMGMTQYPVLMSFQDQVACRAGMQRTTYSANELFPNNRIPLVTERYFDNRRRMIFDESGRNREARADYPFGKPYPYHMMGKIDELYSYIHEDEIPNKDDIKDMMKEIQKEGINEPIYLQLTRSSEEQEFLDRSILVIVAAKELGMVKLPVRMLYVNHPRRSKTVCDWLIRRVIDKYKVGEDKPEPSKRPDKSGGEISRS